MPANVLFIKKIDAMTEPLCFYGTVFFPQYLVVPKHSESLTQIVRLSGDPPARRLQRCRHLNRLPNCYFHATQAPRVTTISTLTTITANLRPSPGECLIGKGEQLSPIYPYLLGPTHNSSKFPFTRHASTLGDQLTEPAELSL